MCDILSLIIGIVQITSPEVLSVLKLAVSHPDPPAAAEHASMLHESSSPAPYWYRHRIPLVADSVNAPEVAQKPGHALLDGTLYWKLIDIGRRAVLLSGAILTRSDAFWEASVQLEHDGMRHVSDDCETQVVSAGCIPCPDICTAGELSKTPNPLPTRAILGPLGNGLLKQKHVGIAPDLKTPPKAASLHGTSDKLSTARASVGSVDSTFPSNGANTATPLHVQLPPRTEHHVPVKFQIDVARPWPVGASYVTALLKVPGVAIVTARTCALPTPEAARQDNAVAEIHTLESEADFPTLILKEPSLELNPNPVAVKRLFVKS